MQLRQKLFQAVAYGHYWLRQVNAHSLQTPFLYQFYTQVLKPSSPPDVQLEALRRQLLRTKEEILITELGAGSSYTKNTRRRLSHLARYSTTPARFSQFLQRLLQHQGATQVLELGTSLGINTAYLARARPGLQITSLEGCPQTARLARQHLADLGLTNAQVLVGNIDDQLPRFLRQSPPLDMVYLDANHRYEPTLRYVEWLLPHLNSGAVLILDDIHWSAGMQRAWNELRQDRRFSLKLDLYEAGLLFLDPTLQPADLVLAY